MMVGWDLYCIDRSLTGPKRGWIETGFFHSNTQVAAGDPGKKPGF